MDFFLNSCDKKQLFNCLNFQISTKSISNLPKLKGKFADLNSNIIDSVNNKVLR